MNRDPWDDYLYSSTLLPAIRLLAIDAIKAVATVSLIIWAVN